LVNEIILIILCQFRVHYLLFCGAIAQVRSRLPHFWRS